MKNDTSNGLNKSKATFPQDGLEGYIMESYILSEEFLEKMSKVGEGSKFSYRSKFDPVPSSALKETDDEEKE